MKKHIVLKVISSAAGIIVTIGVYRETKFLMLSVALGMVITMLVQVLSILRKEG